MRMECAKCLTVTLVMEFEGEYVCQECMEQMIEDDQEI